MFCLRLYTFQIQHVLTDSVFLFFSLFLQSTRHLFTPADRRIPRIRIETRQASTLVGQRIMVAIDGWPKNSRYPNVSLNPFRLMFAKPRWCFLYWCR